MNRFNGFDARREDNQLLDAALKAQDQTGTAIQIAAAVLVCIGIVGASFLALSLGL